MPNDKYAAFRGDLLRAMRKVAKGMTPERAVRWLLVEAPRTDRPEPGWQVEVVYVPRVWSVPQPKHREILALRAEGLTVHQIADRVNLADDTVAHVLMREGRK